MRDNNKRRMESEQKYFIRYWLYYGIIIILYSLWYSNEHQRISVDFRNVNLQLRHFREQSAGEHVQVVALGVAVVGQHYRHLVVHGVQHVVMRHLAGQVQSGVDTAQNGRPRTGHGRGRANRRFCKSNRWKNTILFYNKLRLGFI